MFVQRPLILFIFIRRPLFFVKCLSSDHFLLVEAQALFISMWNLSFNICTFTRGAWGHFFTAFSQLRCPSCFAFCTTCRLHFLHCFKVRFDIFNAFLLRQLLSRDHLLMLEEKALRMSTWSRSLNKDWANEQQHRMNVRAIQCRTLPWIKGQSITCLFGFKFFFEWSVVVYPKTQWIYARRR